MYYLTNFKIYFTYILNIIFCRKIWFFDDIGNKYLDSSSGPMTTNIGYSSELFINLFLEKIIKLHFSYRFQFFNYEIEKLSQKIIFLNRNYKNKCFFLNSGSEASEASIRICLMYFQIRNFLYKKYIIGRYITNHGNTFLSLTYGDDLIRKKSFCKNQFNPDFYNIKLIQCYCFHCPLNKSYKTCKLDCIKKSNLIFKLFNVEKIASIILEPITAASAGVLISSKKYWNYLKYILKKNNILLISDEIVNAFLRIGNWFVKNINSDITIIGKGLGSGFYPISGIIISDFISKTLIFNSPTHYVGHTYCNNALSANVAILVIKYLENKIIIFNILIKKKYIKNIIYFILKYLNIIINVRIKGFLCSIELSIDNYINNFIIYFGYLLGINIYLCRSSGRNRCSTTLLIAPQLIINEYNLYNFIFYIKNILYILFY